MDNIRDIRKGNEFSRIFDSYIVRTNPFGQNLSGEQAYRRSERIAAALHLLTNHVSDKEPSRTRTRELASDLLSSVLTLRSGFRTAGSLEVRGAQACIRELISHIRILTISGFVSGQNAESVLEALDDLGHFLSAAQRSALAETNPISREDLIPKTQVRELKPQVQQKRIIAKQRIVETSEKEVVMDITDKIDGKKNVLDTGRSAIHNSREQNVVEILRSAESVSIKDVAAHFPEYSEKTVQRLLAELVKNGVAKITGMKRWRRYSLVQRS